MRGCKVYATLNTLVNDREIEGAVRCARMAAKYGADGIIIQDVGLIRVLRQFRGAFHDARDTVQYLSREEGEDRIQRSRRVGRLSLLDRSPNGSIRRLYRKEIRRGLTEAPAPWQSPSEIEADASLSDPELHALYEKARYGPQPCTPEDLRRLKRSR